MTNEEKKYLLDLLKREEKQLQYETEQKGCPITYFRRLRLVGNIIKKLNI